MNTQQPDPTITRAIGIMRAAMGITQPVAIIAPADSNDFAIVTGGTCTYKMPLKDREKRAVSKQAKLPKLPESMQGAVQAANKIALSELRSKPYASSKNPAKAQKTQHDVWHYLLGKDKVKS